MQRVHASDLSARIPLRGLNEHVIIPSIAAASKIYSLSNGKCFCVTPSSPLNHSADALDREKSIREEIGDYAYATQYLQCIAGTSDQPAYMRFEPKPPNWKLGDHLGMVFCGVPLSRLIDHHAFGEPMPIYAHWPSDTPLTLEEWEHEAMAHQAKLVAQAQVNSENRASHLAADRR